ncbi:MAG TPA: class I SAM-dependent methyltransferase [Thermoanaerobaculia bacterium]|nr:class I SAM-dependent methyltransferase [Thermoanaerobaculia bacterium]
MPQDFVRDAILAAARRLPGYPKLSVLDLSCGRGEILAALQRDGCRVRGTHYRGDDYKLIEQSEPLETAGLPIDPDVDLAMPLPYADASFEIVILSEVAEHLPNHRTVIAEAGRILAPEGHLILSTPNIARLHSRWHFFWTGTHKLIRRRVGWDLTSDSLYAYHINPIDFPLLHTLLHQAGLKVKSLDFTRFKAKHAWLFALYPLVCLATRIETSRRRTGEAHAAGERDLFRWMVRPAMLASEQLLLTARKGRPAS